MPTLWSELNHAGSTFQVVKSTGENSQAAISLIEQFAGYVRQAGGQAGTVGLPAGKKKEYSFSTAGGQANNILDILQYGMTMCSQSPEKVAVYTGKEGRYTMLCMTILQGSKRTLKEEHITVQVQYNNANQVVKCTYFYNTVKEE